MGKFDDLKASGLTDAKQAVKPQQEDLARYTPEYVEALTQKLSQRIDDLEVRVAVLEKK